MTPAAPELPVARAADLEIASAEHQWLVRQLWTQQAVGIVGGAPKSCKSWFGLDLAVSVASSTPCLGRFAVDDPGTALVYLAEDALPLVRGRIADLCLHRGLSLAALDLLVITAPSLRLDLAADQARLSATVARRKPRLLVLDPLVRLHRLDENSSADVSALLGFLRELQREHKVAIVLVHHMSKRRRADLGQSLRGSGDLHAWTDDSAYLTHRHGEGGLVLVTEHRSAPPSRPVELKLVSRADGSATHLEIVGDSPHDDGSAPAPSAPSLTDRILAALRSAPQALLRAELRETLRTNNQRLGDALTVLQREGVVDHTDRGWTLRGASHATA
jgi:AAA domain